MELQRVFNNNEFEITTYKIDNEIYLKGKLIAQILDYKNTKQAIINHVDEEDKIKFGSFFKGQKNRPLKKNEGNTILIMKVVYIH